MTINNFYSQYNSHDRENVLNSSKLLITFTGIQVITTFLGILLVTNKDEAMVIK